MNIFQKMGQSITHWANQLEHSTSEAYHNSVEATENAVKHAISTLEDAIHSGQTEIVKALAGKKLEEFSEIIESVRTLWPQIQADLGSQIEVLEQVAAYKASVHLQPTLDHSEYQAHSQFEIAQAMTKIANYSSAMQTILAESHSKGMQSWGLEFATDGGLILSGSAGYGFYADITNPCENQAILSLGLSLGVTEGVDAGGAFVLNTASAKKCDGSSILVTLEAVLGGGGGIEFEFNLPDLSFSSLVIMLKGGEDISIAAGMAQTINI